MSEFLESVTSRDYAVMCWLLVLLAVGFRSQSVRGSFGSLIRAAANRKILLTVALALAWTFLATTIAKTFGFWSLSQLKTTAYWFLFAAIPTLASVGEASRDQKLILVPIKSSIKLAAFAGFFVNLYPFPFLVELVFLPFLAMLTAMIMMTEKVEEHERVKGCLEWVMVLVVLLVLAYQIRTIYVDPTHGINVGNLRDLVLPIYYAAIYIPCMFFIAILVAYEEIFCRLRFVVKNRSLIPYTKRTLVIRFGANIRDLNTWFKRSWEEPLLSRSQIDDLIQDVKVARQA